MKKRAIVLLSGGVDSATTLFVAKEKGYDCRALIFDYGQRHKREVESAKKVSRAARSAYTIIKTALPWKGSALLDKKESLPKHRRMADMARDIPPSYVPARNTIFLSYALSFAEAIGAEKIFIGANAVDFSGYPDCRRSYFDAFESVIKEGTRAGALGGRISIEAPLLSMTKAEIIREGRRLGVPFALTWSCYEGKKRPCGACDSCVIRRKGFEEAGLEDPVAPHQSRFAGRCGIPPHGREPVGLHG